MRHHVTICLRTVLMLGLLWPAGVVLSLTVDAEQAAESSTARVALRVEGMT